MAIGTTPLFSKISGSAGPVDFRTRRNGKIEIGKKRIPANPQSTEQQNTRNAYGRLHELWQNAAWIDKTQYENIAAAYDISPWNAFLMRHLSIMRLNPLSYWPAVEGSNNILHDFSPNNNHGTIIGPSWEIDEKYKIPYLKFDGIDDKVTISNPCLSMESMTVCERVHKVSYTINGGLVADYSVSPIKKNFILGYENPNGRLHFYVGNGTNIDNIAIQNFHAGQTHFAAGIFSGIENLLKIYLNGATQEKATTINNIGPDQSLCSAIGEYSCNRYFDGLSYETIMFETALTTSQLLKIEQLSNKFYEV